MGRVMFQVAFFFPVTIFPREFFPPPVVTRSYLRVLRRVAVF